MTPAFKRIFVLLSILSLLSGCNNKSTDSATVKNGFEEQLQEKIDRAQEGDVIELPEGTYQLTSTLSVKNTKNLIIRGQGREKTVLVFKDLHGGDAGFTVTADGTILEDFTLLDSKGDGIKADNARGVTIRQVRVGWTNKAAEHSGSFGCRFSNCYSIMVDNCEFRHASNAGIYLLKSRDAVLRRNHVSYNVAGIELENCSDVDVNDNLIDSNSVGTFLCSLPGSSKRNMSRCRIFNNRIHYNNSENTAAKGTLVSEIPSGTGLLLLAVSHCDIFNNSFNGQNTVDALLLSCNAIQKIYTDKQYDPYCSGVSVHDNQFPPYTGTPSNKGLIGHLLSDAYSNKVPDIVYDGASNPQYKNSDGSTKDDRKICIRNNAEATFGDMDLPGGGVHRSADLQRYDCSLPGLNDVKLN